MSLYTMLRVGSVGQKGSPRRIFPVSLRDSLSTLVTLVLACVLCMLLRALGGTDEVVPLIFVLAILVISMHTEGYLYGILSSLAAVFGINYAFTYPYFAFNFSLSGYPLTFALILAVAIITGTLTSRIKQQERMKRESEMEKTRANLLRSVSHDLRTPLTSIIGAANLLLENNELSPEETRELLVSSRNDAQWLIRMVENLLSITRVGEGAAKIDMEPEAPEEVLSEAVTKFRRQPKHVPVGVTVPDEPLFVPMNALLIEQVLLNLFDNAVTHGETTTHIWATVTVKGERAVFLVEDNGVGLAESRTGLVRELIAASDSKRDMGIGLSVCETIIRAHGGTVSSGRSETHGGALLCFELPLKEDKHAGEE